MLSTLKTRHFLHTLLFASVLLVGSPAQADAIDGVPIECPTGARSDLCHGGPYCSPIDCQKDADCPGGHCEARALCMGTIICNGRLPPEQRDNPPKTATVEGYCEANACPRGGKCETLKVCMPGPASPGSGDTGSSASSSHGEGPSVGPHPASGARGCGCELGAPSTLWAGVLVSAGFLVLGFRARRRR